MLRGPALAPRVLTLHALLRQTLLAAMQQPSIPRLPCNLTWLSVQMWPGSVPSPSVGLIWAEPIIAKPSPLQAQARGPAPANEMLLGVGSATGDRYLLLSHEKVQTGKGALLPAPPFLCVAPCPHSPRSPGGLPEWRRGWRRRGKSSGLLRKGLSRQVLGLDTSTDFPLACTYLVTQPHLAARETGKWTLYYVGGVPMYSAKIWWLGKERDEFGATTSWPCCKNKRGSLLGGRGADVRSSIMKRESQAYPASDLCF